MTAGKLIARHRRADHLSQSKVATALGVTPRTYRKIEAGQRPVTIEEAHLLAGLLTELTAEDILEAARPGAAA